jgi:hypothetical protein
VRTFWQQNDVAAKQRWTSAVGGGLGLSKKQQQRYFDLKARADSETFEDVQALAAEDAVASGVRAAVSALEEQLAAVDAQAAKLRGEIETVLACASALPVAHSTTADMHRSRHPRLRTL